VMVEESKVAVLKEAYRAFNARDIDAALATMQADVEWPNGMEVARFTAVLESGNTGRGSGQPESACGASGFRSG